MTYRKIEVNGKKFEYVVGKQVIKIKGIGVFPIEGNSTDYVVDYCECGCGMTYAEIEGGDEVTRPGVTPKNVRALIERHESL